MHEQICMHDILHTSPQKMNDLCTRLKIGRVQRSLLCGDVAITSYQIFAHPCKSSDVISLKYTDIRGVF